MARRWLPFFFVLSAGCSDDPLSKVEPKIVVDPESLDFGIGVVGAATPGKVTVKNVGPGLLRVSSATIEPSGRDDFSVVSFPMTLASNATAAVAMIYTAKRAHVVSTSALVIASNDPERPELRVPLRGEGGVREIDVVPAEIDFGVVNEGTSPTRSVEIRNIGGDPLEIARITFTSTSIDLDLVPGTFTSGTILPGTSTTVDLVYSPVDLGGDRGVLTIFSDDEDEPEVNVPVRGSANLAPRAIAFACAPEGMRAGCDGAPDKARVFTAGLRQRLLLDGRESFDPEGGEIASWRWVIESKPAGSNAAIFHSTEDRTLRKNATGDVEIDVVGTFELRLYVRDDRGLESLDRPESHVTIRPKDLEVLLRWDVATDVDLHFVRPGGMPGDYGTGAAGTSTGSDASTFNRRPNWGDLSISTDDPSLDIDDVSGRGPEVISMDRPAPDGTYEVFAHYCDSRDIGVTANATIEIYVRGEKVATIPETNGLALAPGELWRGARVTWRESGGMVRAEVVGGVGERPVNDPSLCRLR
jgi:hypothetical protein